MKGSSIVVFDLYGSEAQANGPRSSRRRVESSSRINSFHTHHSSENSPTKFSYRNPQSNLHTHKFWGPKHAHSICFALNTSGWLANVTKRISAPLTIPTTVYGRKNSAIQHKTNSSSPDSLDANLRIQVNY